MKTIRLDEKILNEAPTTVSTSRINSGTLNAWKAAWEDPTSDKLSVVKSILQDVDVDDSIINKILSFGETFVTRWINAMKLDEIAFTGNAEHGENEFICVLKTANTSDPFLSNQNNFTKLYNIYANNTFNDSYMDEYRTYLRLLKSPEAYAYEDKDFSKLFTIFNSLVEKKDLDDAALEGIFFEGPSLRSISEISSSAQIALGQDADALKNKAVDLGKETAENIKKFTKEFLDQLKPVIRDGSILANLENEILSSFNIND